jgi:hypothetical protein
LSVALLLCITLVLYFVLRDDPAPPAEEGAAQEEVSRTTIVSRPTLVAALRPEVYSRK